MSNAIVFDTETTGLSRDIDRVVELAIVDWKTGAGYSKRFNPEMPIPPEATNVHGITDDMVKDCPPFRVHAEEFHRAFSEPEAVIGYNPFFDIGMLDAEFARCGMPPVKWPTVVCAKRTWDCHEPSDRNLMSAYRRFVNRAGFDAAHSALADTRACRDVLMSQIEHFGLMSHDWSEFDPERKLWWGPSHHILIVEQTLMMNFGKWRGKPVRDVDHGFWRWLLDRDFPKHLLLLAMHATKLIEEGASKSVLDVKLYSWALEHAKENLK